MHQTTVRFGRDLWQALEREALAAGVSVAQFVREAAVARLAQNAAERAPLPPGHLGSGAEARSRAARADAEEIVLDSAAVWAQSQQARSRSRELRDQSKEARLTRSAEAGGERAPAQLVASDNRPPA
jgi:hypothetical protein